MVPATWDETKVLDGKIGEYVVIARRRGTEWFVGAMTDGARKLTIPLAFLGSGAYEATVYADVPESAAAPTKIGITPKALPPAKTARSLEVSLVPGGGAAVHIRPAR